ncbi:GNAT family N-acetyltransferase [Marivibrio sp.]|uniref:GNAT family N-acetyltransferase n=1 Tax=Marivibrio sp. TaxID=2039719 RepID=UPI0032EC4B12
MVPVAYAERDGGHIRLMVVAGDRQGRGLSRRLPAGLPDGFEGEAATLSASDFALPRYRALGFVATGPRTCFNGVVHTPMRKAPHADD